MRVDAVQPGEGLHGLNAGQALVDVQGVQQGLVEAGLILLRHQQHLVFAGGEVLRQFRFPNALVHRNFGVGNAGGLVVFDGSRKGHQGLDGVSLLLNVAVKTLLVANGLKARAGDHHRLRPPANLVARECLKVLHHHLRFLGDVVGMQLHEAGQGAGGLLALHIRVVIARLDELVVAIVGNIVLQHIEDEAFLNGLTHGVAVAGLAIAPKDLERPVLRRGGEGEKAQVRLPPALRHAEEQRLHVLPGHALLGRLLSCPFPQFFAAQHFLHGGGRLSALGTVRLVDEHGAASGWQGVGGLFGCFMRGVAPSRSPAEGSFLRHLEQLAGNERELLQGGDDDGNSALQGFCQLARALVHLLHHAMLVLELIDGVLQLLIQHDAVRHDDHAIEDTGVFRVVQRRQTMRQPSDGVALAAAGGMLDQGVVPHAFPPRHIDQQAHRLKLVVAGKDQRLRLHLAPLLIALLFALQVQETGQQVQQAAALQNFLPKVGGAVVASFRVRRVAGAGISALVKGQKARGRARQPGGHLHGFGIDSEMNQGAPLEGKNWRLRVSVALILPAGILHSLPCERILQLKGCNGNAVHAKHHIQGLFRTGREVQLPGDAKPVGGVASFKLWI